MKKLLYAIIAILALVAGYLILKNDTSPMTEPAPVADTVPIEQPVPAPLLQATGLADSAFGMPTDAAVAKLTTVFGTPTKDTGTIGSFSIYGTCPGTEIRVVEWDSLRAFFGDTKYGTNAFFHYEYMKTDATAAPFPLLATPKGVTIGTTQAQLRASYPDAIIDESVPDYQFFRLKEGKDSIDGILYNGVAVSWISAGVMCGD